MVKVAKVSGVTPITVSLRRGSWRGRLHNARPMNDYPLEPNASEMHRLVDEAMRRIVAHIESLPSQPASHVDGAAELARTLIEPLPKRGIAYEQLLDFLFDEAIPRSFNAAGPGYLAY